MKNWQLAIISVAVIAVIAIGGIIFSASGGTAASVNGVPVAQADIDKQFALIKQQQQKVFEGPAGADQEKRFRASILDYLITAELIRQEAKKQGVTVSESDVDTRVAQIKKIFDNNQARFEQALKEQGMTPDELRSKLHDQAVAEKMLARVNKGIKTDEKAIKAYYEKNKSQFAEPEQKRWRQIVVSHKKKADDLIEKINDGADFAVLAKANSADQQTKAQGGEIGWMSDSNFPPDIAKELTGLGVNDVSKSLKGPDGYHIFQLLEIKPARKRSFEEVKGQIKQTLLRDEQRARSSAWLKELKKKAEIKKNAS